MRLMQRVLVADGADNGQARSGGEEEYSTVHGLTFATPSTFFSLGAPGLPLINVILGRMWGGRRRMTLSASGCSCLLSARGRVSVSVLLLLCSLPGSGNRVCCR